MKIQCQCSAVILDATDNQPHKAHLIPDTHWHQIMDQLTDQVIRPMLKGKLNEDTAWHRARDIIANPARPIYQCSNCGRIYLNDQNNQLQCFDPQNEHLPKDLLAD